LSYGGSKMGTFVQRIGVGAAPEGPFVEVEALVDTGATYTWLPRPLLERLRVRAGVRRDFETADGRVIQREMGEVAVRLNGEVHFTLVVFGDEGTRPLLGVVTLETFGLGVDPVQRRLVPVRGLLMAGVIRSP
jgi:clan AA aspartic protease